MQVLILVALIVATFVLWRRQEALDMRLRLLEADAPRPAAWPEADEIEASVPPPFAAPEAAPAPTAPPPPLPPPVVVDEPAIEAPHRVAPEPETAPARPWINFEDLFGRRLPIWAGGITLAIAGTLIVRFSIEAGLFPPIVRVICGLIFGLGLIGGAEFAHRNTDRVRDPRVAQALAGAAIADLYASILIAANLYHLVPPLAAFAGMAGVTAAAMGLALRFGAPSALLGLAGGLMAPALVGGGPANIPLLSTYLALVAGGLCALSRRQRWAWLGIGALVGGFGWGGVLILGGALDGIATLSTGLYVIALGMAFPLLAAAGAWPRIQRLASGLVAAVQIAALVATGGFALLNWGLFGLLSIGIAWLAWRDARLRLLPPLGMAIAFGLLLAWPAPSAMDFAIVTVIAALIHAGPALVRLWKGDDRLIEAGQIAATGAASLLLALLHFHHAHDGRAMLFGGLALACAALPAIAARLGWRIAGRRDDARFAALAMTASALVAMAGVLACPTWAIPVWVVATGLALLLLGHEAEDIRIEPGAWVLAGSGVLLLALDGHFAAELSRAIGLHAAPAIAWLAMLRWTAIAALLGGFAWKGRWPVAPALAQAFALLSAYAAVAQVLPSDPLPLAPAIGLVLLAGWSRTLTANRLLPGMITATGLILAWAAVPLASWAAPAMGSLVGMPMLAPLLPPLHDVMLRLLVPAVAMVGSLALARPDREARAIGVVVAALLGGVAGHILYKQLFHLSTRDAFVHGGLMERTLWEALLLGAGLLAWRVAHRRPLAIGLAIAAIAHGVVYSLLIHNPLWADQSVGAWPLLNGVAFVYAMPLIGLWLAPRLLPSRPPAVDRGVSIGWMAMILLLCVSELRQLVHGAFLDIGGVTGPEDVLRSVSAIAIAVGFLLWGIRTRRQAWRIGSLALMLAAVGKVFLVDAADLDGLLRIASFVALGFSLIGIGWLYSRYLKLAPEATTA